MTAYAELCVTSAFTFLTGASHPEELVTRAAELGLTAIAIPSADRAPSLPHQAIRLNADVASIGMRAVELAERGRVTRTERNTIVSVATSAMGSLALLIHDVESRFQAVPAVACASDILMQTMTM